MRLNIAERVIDLAIQIQQIPAPTFAEGKRAEFVRGLFTKEGLEEVEIDECDFGGVRKGRRGRAAVGKVPVCGLLKRGGHVVAAIIPHAHHPRAGSAR